MLGKIFGLKRMAGENCIMRSFITFVDNLVLFAKCSMRQACSKHGREDE
jgi:hypothetical protein